jgi:cytoskeletal protein CcmA (bactofilin family)
MSTEKQGDIIINGMGTSNGGRYEQVLISGKGTVNGELDCNFFKCNGTGVVNGDLTCNKAKVSGNAKINGNVTSGDLLIEGRATITGEANINKVVIRGKGSVGGHLKGEELRIQGSAFIGGDCEVETFKAEGWFVVDGLLTAESIDIQTFGECKAGEIGGQTIRVRQKPNFLRDLLKVVFPVRLETDLIEGDQIELENTKAKIVRGSHIIIGENCEIDLVEYKQSFRVEKNGQVKKNIQL